MLDPAFDPGKGADDFVTSILPQADGSMFVGGQFLTFDKKPYVRLVRLDNNGSISAGFAPLPVSDTVFTLAAQIEPLTGAPNGQVLVGGDFQTVGNATYPKLVRIDQAGNIDSSFKPTIDQRVLAIAVQPDGKIVHRRSVYQRRRTGGRSPRPAQSGRLARRHVQRERDRHASTDHRTGRCLYA